MNLFTKQKQVKTDIENKLTTTERETEGGIKAGVRDGHGHTPVYEETKQRLTHMTRGAALKRDRNNL